MAFNELALQCAMEFADQAALFGGYPDATDLFLEMRRSAYLEHLRTYRKERRLMLRLERQHKESRMCCFCGRVFVVVVPTFDGCVPKYCGATCRDRMKRWLKRARTPVELRTCPVCGVEFPARIPEERSRKKRKYCNAKCRDIMKSRWQWARVKTGKTA